MTLGTVSHSACRRLYDSNGDYFHTSINRLAFITETVHVLFEAETEILCIIQLKDSIKKLNVFTKSSLKS